MPLVGVKQHHFGVVQGARGHVYLIEQASLGSECEEVLVAIVVQHTFNRLAERGGRCCRDRVAVIVDDVRNSDRQRVGAGAVSGDRNVVLARTGSSPYKARRPGIPEVVVVRQVPLVGVQQHHFGVVQGAQGNVYLIELASLGSECEDILIAVEVQRTFHRLIDRGGRGCSDRVAVVVDDVRNNDRQRVGASAVPADRNIVLARIRRRPNDARGK